MANQWTDNRKIVPLRTVYFEELEGGFVHQCEGEPFCAFTGKGQTAYFDTVEEARKFISDLNDELPLVK